VRTAWTELDQTNLSGNSHHLQRCLQVTKGLDKLAVSIDSCVTHIPKHCSQTIDKTTMESLLRLMSKAISKPSILSIGERRASELLQRKQISLNQPNQFNKPVLIMRPSLIGTTVKTMSSMKSTLNSPTTHFHLLEHPLTNKITLKDRRKNFVECKTCLTITLTLTTSSKYFPNSSSFCNVSFS
jgi:hypothetical protein